MSGRDRTQDYRTIDPPNYRTAGPHRSVVGDLERTARRVVGDVVRSCPLRALPDDWTRFVRSCPLPPLPDDRPVGDEFERTERRRARRPVWTANVRAAC